MGGEGFFEANGCGFNTGFCRMGGLGAMGGDGFGAVCGGIALFKDGECHSLCCCC